MKNILEIKKTSKEDIVPDTNVIFNTASPYSDGVVYDSSTGEITFVEIGQYSVMWWVSTETALTGCIQFALRSLQGDTLIGCSPTKRGQVSGFGIIDIKSANVTLSLVNVGTCPVVLSQTSPVTASLIAMKIPEDGVIPTFAVDKVETLEPGEAAAADVQEDTDNPNNWLFSFGIPKGENGIPGIAPHIDSNTGNWFIGEVDTTVQAQGPVGPTGPPGPTVGQVYNRNLSAAGASCDVVIGDVIYQVLRTSSTIRIWLLPLDTSKPVRVDVKRSSNYDNAAMQARTFDDTLLQTQLDLDTDMLINSNEMHRTWLRQLNPEGTLCSLCEVDLFISKNGARVSVWVNWIYKDVPISDFV